MQVGATCDAAVNRGEFALSSSGVSLGVRRAVAGGVFREAYITVSSTVVATVSLFL
jgi:hypothetical protein